MTPFLTFCYTFLSYVFAAPTFAWVVFGRIVVGFAVAVSGIADVSYLHEIAPIHLRYDFFNANDT
jgi:predicted MFS family arabinose efflux permease